MTTVTYVADTRPEEKEPYKAINPDHPRLAIKHDKVFLLTDMQGMMPGNARQGFGLYADDTRWLSCWDFTLNGKPLFLLNGSVDDGFAGTFSYANRDLDGIANQSILIQRHLVIVDDQLYERVHFENFGETAVNLELSLQFFSDFADMFEVRGARRPKRGQLMVPFLSPDKSYVALAYEGLDKHLRETFIDFLGARPDELAATHALFSFKLERHEHKELLFKVSIRTDATPATTAPPASFRQAANAAQSRFQSWVNSTAKVTTANPEFNQVLRRAYNDIYILRQMGDGGPVVAAGVPWFAVPFGRDSLITALQMLPYTPTLAADVLRFFAHWQGKKHDAETTEAPGKIMHELRRGEMALLGEIAFRPYYGTADATQLWLILLNQYVAWTGDLALAKELWNNAVAAELFLSFEVARGQGFVTYGGVKGQALSNQGWKDSGNALAYSDGSTANPQTTTIALCELQAYLYSAWLGLAPIANRLGHRQFAQELRSKARGLRSRFQKRFWMEEKGFVALAVDGNGRQCDVISSNPGHLLATGILTKRQEKLVCRRLMQDDMFCGWGIRTMAASEKAYQPLDYQLGSVWPHDNSIAVLGMCQSGFSQDAHRVMFGLLQVALAQPDKRLPELFAGLPEERSNVPIRYPVACIPQAWAAGSFFLMLKGCLGLRADASKKQLRIVNPSLPAWLETLTVTGLQVGKGTVDLEFQTDSAGATQCRVLRSQAVRCLIEHD